MELGGIEEDEEVVGFRGFFLVIMWWLFLVDVVVVGGFWRLKFCFFFPLWWLFLVVGVVVVIIGRFGDLSCGFSYGCGLLGLI